MDDSKLLFLMRRGLKPHHYFLDLNDFSLHLVEYMDNRRYFDIKIDKALAGKRPKRKTFDFIWGNMISVDAIEFLIKSLKKGGICYATIHRDDMNPFQAACMEYELRFETVGLTQKVGLAQVKTKEANKLVIKCTK